MTKMTYVDALNVAIEAVDGEVRNKLEALKIQLTKKAGSKNSKATAESAERAERLYAALAEMEKPVTITELKQLTSDTEVADWNTQRISALYRKLGDRVTSEVIKGKKYFAVA